MSSGMDQSRCQVRRCTASCLSAVTTATKSMVGHQLAKTMALGTLPACWTVKLLSLGPFFLGCCCVMERACKRVWA